jgi:hypothetical protein
MRRNPVKKILIAVTLMAGLATSGCLAVAAGAGAGAVACTEKEIDCPVD